MPTTVYGIRNCDTVKRARAWLSAHGVEHAFHDFKTQGVPADNLRRWADTAGHQVLLNRQGTTWRKLADAEKASVVDTPSALALMSAHASVIKRPVVEWSDGAITVGFDEASFASHR